MQILSVWDYNRWDGGERHNHKAYVTYAGNPDFDVLLGVDKEFKNDAAYKIDLVVCTDMFDLKMYMNGEQKRNALAKAKSVLTEQEMYLLGIKDK